MPSIEEHYRLLVQNEISVLRAYYSRQHRRYRTTRLVVLVSAAAVPVLAAASAVPRWVLGLLGALATVAEGVQQVFQFRLSSLNALKTANELERELNLYVMGVKEYAGARDVADSRFVERIEEIRRGADRATFETWQQTPTAVGGRKDAVDRGEGA
jgi:hypothetical protein